MTKNAKDGQHDTKKPEETKALVKKEYTDAEKARARKYLERIERKPVKLERTGKGELTIANSDGLGLVKFAEALGTPDSGLQNYLLNQLSNTFFGYDDSRLVEVNNNSLALLNGIQPQDEIEGMLAIQMIAVHNMAMETMRRAMITGQTFQGTEGNVNNATKMLRTFAVQMEALKRYRTGGQQKVIVEHVNVNQGGQAIVGAVSTGGRGYGEQKHE